MAVCPGFAVVPGEPAPGGQDGQVAGSGGLGADIGVCTRLDALLDPLQVVTQWGRGGVLLGQGFEFPSFALCRDLGEEVGQSGLELLSRFPGGLACS